MSNVKTCPLCGAQKWKSDDKFVLDQHDLAEFRLYGLTISDLQTAIEFAKSRGWKK